MVLHLHQRNRAKTYIKIDYPGANNFSQFSYDGWGRNSKLVETVSGSVTSTKQFVRCADKLRRYQPCEERDAGGTLTKQFFTRGQVNNTTKYFYSTDHLASVREMSNNSGVLQAQYSFDPYGRISKISEAVASDFTYAEYYLHSQSQLNLTLTRAYQSNQNRFINRDLIEELGGVNLYTYVRNSPVQFSDPSGTQGAPCCDPKMLPWYAAAALGGAAMSAMGPTMGRATMAIRAQISSLYKNLGGKPNCALQRIMDENECATRRRCAEASNTDPTMRAWDYESCMALAAADYYICQAANAAGL